MSKEIEAKENEIQAIQNEYKEIITDLEARLEGAKRTRDEKIVALQQERDALALELKLKDFPARLVKKHATCSICGATMRPFVTADKDGNVKKIWACQAGNLQDTHDLILVDG